MGGRGWASEDKLAHPRPPTIVPACFFVFLRISRICLLLLVDYFVFCFVAFPNVILLFPTVRSEYVVCDANGDFAFC